MVEPAFHLTLSRADWLRISRQIKMTRIRSAFSNISGTKHILDRVSHLSTGVQHYAPDNFNNNNGNCDSKDKRNRNRTVVDMFGGAVDAFGTI